MATKILQGAPPLIKMFTYPLTEDNNRNFARGLPTDIFLCVWFLWSIGLGCNRGGSRTYPITYFPENNSIPNGSWVYCTFMRIYTHICSRINYWTEGGQNRGDRGGSEKGSEKGRKQ